MNVLTDLEICKRIAEIDGVEFNYNDKRVMFWRKEDAPVETYNPLTDDDLCFKLMVKYQVDLNHYNDESGGQMFWVFAHGVSDDNYDNANKAICLAIIEINKLNK